MTLKEIEKLENGTLIKISGKNYLGETITEIKVFDKENHKATNKGLMCGFNLYPIEWVKLATKSDYDRLCDNAKKDYEKEIARYTKAYELTKKQGGR